MPELVSRKALEDLRGKYLEILAMRVAHPADDEDESIRTRMAELASRFPGALRELDDLELDEIRRRAAALDVVLCEGTAAERWMEATVLFHALARGALCAKRWLLGRKHVDAELERAYAVAVTALAFPEDARAWAFDLARVASPPRRRLSNAIFERLAGCLGTTEREAKMLVFGAPRRGRRDGSNA